MPNQHPFTSPDTLTQLLQKQGVHNWSDLIQFIQHLPYGRNSNRTDLSLVIQEGKGTCSSKHALLKKVADLNGIQQVELVLGMYKMTEANTPKIGHELTKNDLNHIPEAHCYLKVDGVRTDVTHANASFAKIETDLLEEQTITPEQVGDFKVAYHREYVKNWIKQEAIVQSFEEVWKIREQCIANLAE